MQVIGECSICGGNVVFPNMIVSPRAYCENCGAREARNVIPMVPYRPFWDYGSPYRIRRGSGISRNGDFDSPRR